MLIRKIGYKGLIVSDDMEMGGILNYTGIAEAAVRSLAAGMHVVEICRDPALVFAAYEAVLREAEASPAFARLLRSAAAKVRAVAAARPKRLPPSPTSAAVKRMRTAVERFTEAGGKSGSGMSAALTAMTVAGIMSGTSADGIDVAFTRIAPRPRGSGNLLI